MNKKLSLMLVAISLALILPQAAEAIIIDAQVTTVTGKAYVLQPGATTKSELKPGMSLAPGSTVTTESGTVGLQLMPGAVSVLEPASELNLTRLNYEKKDESSLKRNVLLDLKKGSVLSSLQKTGTSDFKIKTPYGVAAARGTTWKVVDDKTSVYDGTVEVTLDNGKVVRIGKGTFVVFKNGEATAAEAITEQELQDILDELKKAGFDVKIDGAGSSTRITVTPPGSGTSFRDLNPSNLKGDDTTGTEPGPGPTPTPNIP